MPSHPSLARAAALVSLCLAAALAAGCAPRVGAPDLARQANLPARVRLDSVPFHPQEKYQCGPAALAMALSWSGTETTPAELRDAVYTPGREGSMQQDLKAAARGQGRLAYEISGIEELMPELAAGHPVVVLQNLGLSWFPKWHYAVVVGYDLKKGETILHTGITQAARKDLDTFAATWRRSDSWGLLVLEPGTLPATAKRKRYLRAVLGLERAKRYRAATLGYRAGRDHWPDSLTAALGEGNCLYRAGRHEAAIKAYRQAVESHPDSPELHNNLAHVLLERDRPEEALEAARKAVDLADSDRGTYRETLRAIRSHLP